ncbi:hypothetical protein DM02DRAFT_706490 [Periconia macrospinosa]|uniref:Short-chain dehydrogenase n=1 Tax=Periconia macrospinosa TaxID=97972 RepID=A0A2V1DW78_9PLEO|nr:hypothetical protein DM02DRAFT_706490 [Periconia macrospinosa]
MSITPLVLLLGVGPNIGTAIKDNFKRRGYNVAVASRSMRHSVDEDGVLCIGVDFSTTTAIPATFEAARMRFGRNPDVVIYNAYSLTPPPVEHQLFSISADQLAADLTVNTVSPYMAASEALKRWQQNPTDSTKTFIYTGNVQNVRHLAPPMFATIGSGKAASAYWIGTADTMYAEQGYRFFYADERKDNGDMTGAEVDPDAHGQFYAMLAAGGGQIPWHATFVKEKGYVRF